MKAGVIRILAFLLCLCTVLSQFGLPVSAEEAVETQPPQEQEETAPPEREPAKKSPSTAVIWKQTALPLYPASNSS